MRLLLFGDLAATGFGSVTSDLGKALLDLGVDLRFVSQNDTGDDLPEPFRSRTVNLITLQYAFNEISGEQGATGANDGIPALLRGEGKALLHSGEPYAGWKPDAVLVLADYMAVVHIVGRFLDAFRAIPSFHYCPIEGIDLPPAWKELWQTVSPVAMSNFGADEIAKVMGYRPPMIYHGVDTKVFHPATKANPIILKQGNEVVPLQSKADCKWALLEWLAKSNLSTLPRRENGVAMPTNWMLRTDRHMPRKQYNVMLKALAPVLERNPDWGLIVHCGVLDQGGFLHHTLSKLSPEARSRVILTSPDVSQPSAIPREILVTLYNAADLYVSTSAEGFGLTIAEALACGVPAVGLDYSAVPEVIGPAGVVVPPAYLFENEYDHLWASVDPEQLARRVEFLLTHKGRREDLGRKGPAHVAATFSWQQAARQFVDLIEPHVSSTGVAA